MFYHSRVVLHTLVNDCSQSIMSAVDWYTQLLSVCDILNRNSFCCKEPVLAALSMSDAKLTDNNNNSDVLLVSQYEGK